MTHNLSLCSRFTPVLVAFLVPVAAMAQTTTAPAVPEPVSLIGRAVPDVSSLPPGSHKALVEYGQQLTERRSAHIGPEVKNQAMRLACASRVIRPAPRSRSPCP